MSKYEEKAAQIQQKKGFHRKDFTFHSTKKKKSRYNKKKQNKQHEKISKKLNFNGIKSNTRYTKLSPTNAN